MTSERCISFTAVVRIIFNDVSSLISVLDVLTLLDQLTNAFNVLFAELFELGVLLLLLLDPKTILSLGEYVGLIFFTIFEHFAQEFHSNLLKPLMRQ